MYGSLYRTGFYLCSAVVAPKPVKDVFDGKEETGWDRVCNVFSVNEHNEISPELANIYHVTLTTGFFGACYGGFIHSRDAYLKFIESNEATKFSDHLEAKRRLQDTVSTNFFKGAVRWSWRIALFGGMYTAFTTLVSAYRGSHSITDYMLAGTLSGGLYRMNYGVRGIIIGSTLGLMVGLFAGSMTLLLLKFADKDYDDITEWQKSVYYAREKQIQKAWEEAVIKEENLVMLSEHDKKIDGS